MNYNAVLDANRSEGSAFSGAGQLLPFTITSTQGQTDFSIPADSILFLFFIDGIKYEPVNSLEELTTGRTYHYDAEEGVINILTGQDAGVQASGLYLGTGNLTQQAEPVTLIEAKNWLRIDDVPEDDDLITELITSARDVCELYTNISFIVRIVTAQLINLEGGIYLPYGPVQDILTAKDNDGEDLTGYEIKGVAFKQLKTAYCEEVTLSYKAGYSVLPKNLKTALLHQIAFMYENRGDASISPMAKSMLNQVKRT